MRTRAFLCLAAVCLALAGVSASAQYPQRPVRMIVPNPPGGATDTVARLFTPKLSEALGQPVLVDNRSGSNGNLATDMVGKATPDGYTLLLAADAQIVISPHLYAMATDPMKDLIPLSSLVTTHLMLVAGASVPAKNLREFVEYARRAKPALAYASIGNGSQHQLAMEMLKAKAGIDLVHVPYKGGGPAMVALLAGDVAAMFGGNSVSGQVKAGKVRPLAAAGAKRIAAYPDLPTIGEIYPGVEVTPWLGTFAPAGTPAPVLARLRTETARLLADPEIRDRTAKGGLELWTTSADEFAAVVRADYAKYGDIVKAVGIKVE